MKHLAIFTLLASQAVFAQTAGIPAFDPDAPLLIRNRYDIEEMKFGQIYNSHPELSSELTNSLEQSRKKVTQNLLLKGFGSNVAGGSVVLGGTYVTGAIATGAAATFAWPMLIPVAVYEANQGLKKLTDGIDQKIKDDYRTLLFSSLDEYRREHRVEYENLAGKSKADIFNELYQKSPLLKDLDPSLLETSDGVINYELSMSLGEAMAKLKFQSNADKDELDGKIAKGSKDIKEIGSNLRQAKKLMEEWAKNQKANAQSAIDLQKEQGQTLLDIRDERKQAYQLLDDYFQNGASWEDKMRLLTDPSFAAEVGPVKMKAYLSAAKNDEEGRRLLGQVGNYADAAHGLINIARALNIDSQVLDGVQHAVGALQVCIAATIKGIEGGALGWLSGLGSMASLFSIDPSTQILQELDEIRDLEKTILENEQEILKIVAGIQQEVQFLREQVNDLSEDLYKARNLLREISQTGYRSCVVFLDHQQDFLTPQGFYPDRMAVENHVQSSGESYRSCLTWIEDTAIFVGKSVDDATVPLPEFFLDSTYEGNESNRVDFQRRQAAAAWRRDLLGVASDFLATEVNEAEKYEEGDKKSVPEFLQRIFYAGEFSREQLMPLEPNTSAEDAELKKSLGMVHRFLVTPLSIPAVLEFGTELLNTHPFFQREIINKGLANLSKSHYLRAERYIKSTVKLIDFAILQERFLNGIGWMPWLDHALSPVLILDYVRAYETNPAVANYAFLEGDNDVARHSLNADALTLLRRNSTLARNWIVYRLQRGTRVSLTAKTGGADISSIFDKVETGFPDVFRLSENKIDPMKDHQWSIILGSDRASDLKGLPPFSVPIPNGIAFDRTIADAHYVQSPELVELQNLRQALVLQLAEYQMVQDPEIGKMFDAAYIPSLSARKEQHE